jgi:hypothetical protein
MREFLNSFLQGERPFWLFMLGLFCVPWAFFFWGRATKECPTVANPRDELNFPHTDPESLAEWRALQELQAGCVCQDRHRRGYCTEQGCPYAMTSTDRGGQ